MRKKTFHGVHFFLRQSWNNRRCQFPIHYKTTSLCCTEKPWDILCSFLNRREPFALVNLRSRLRLQPYCTIEAEKLIVAEVPNATRVQVTQFDWTYGEPPELDDLEMASPAHAPDLPVFSLVYDELDPGGSGPFGHGANLGRLVSFTADRHAVTHTLEPGMVIVEVAADFDAVAFG